MKFFFIFKIFQLQISEIQIWDFCILSIIIVLSMYLTRIEVPLEEQSPEVVRLMNAVEQKMEEFKILHAQNVETRTDFLRAVDVRNDLKAMEEEREQLQRKIERCKRRTNRRQDMGNLLLTAER